MTWKKSKVDTQTGMCALFLQLGNKQAVALLLAGCGSTVTQ
jgi:hypothetical protein